MGWEGLSGRPSVGEGEPKEPDAGDQKGPPRPSTPPSPLRTLMGFSFG